MKHALIISAGRPGNGAPEEGIPGRSGEVMKIARIRTQSAWTRQKLGLTNRTAGRRTIYYPWPGSRDSAADPLRDLEVNRRAVGTLSYYA